MDVRRSLIVLVPCCCMFLPWCLVTPPSQSHSSISSVASHLLPGLPLLGAPSSRLLEHHCRLTLLPRFSCLVCPSLFFLYPFLLFSNPVSWPFLQACLHSITCRCPPPLPASNLLYLLSTFKCLSSMVALVSFSALPLPFPRVIQHACEYTT